MTSAPNPWTAAELQSALGRAPRPMDLTRPLSLLSGHGEQPKAEKCPGIEGLKKEHDQFVTDEKPSDDVLDMFLTGAAARTEHYEIAAYTGLITMADALGETDAAKLLGENLKQEKAALKTVTTISEKLATKTPANA